MLMNQHISLTIHPTMAQGIVHGNEQTMIYGFPFQVNHTNNATHAQAHA
jgi:hypothetical protein